MGEGRPCRCGTEGDHMHLIIGRTAYGNPRLSLQYWWLARCGWCFSWHHEYPRTWEALERRRSRLLSSETVGVVEGRIPEEAR